MEIENNLLPSSSIAVHVDDAPKTEGICNIFTSYFIIKIVN